MIDVPMGFAAFENVVVRDARDKALKVELDDGTHLWVPRSIIADESEVYEEDTEGTLIIPEWFAETKGII